MALCQRLHRVRSCVNNRKEFQPNKNESTMSIPSEPTHEQTYLEWKFVFYVGSRDWDGLVSARAEVWQQEKKLCSFATSRKATPPDAQARLREECVAWVESQALQ